jgi:hypothetical protein
MMFAKPHELLVILVVEAFALKAVLTLTFEVEGSMHADQLCAQLARQRAHDLKREVGRLANAEQKRLLRNRGQRDIGLGDRRGVARFIFDQRHFTENALRPFALKVMCTLAAVYAQNSGPGAVDHLAQSISIQSLKAVVQRRSLGASI